VSGSNSGRKLPRFCLMRDSVGVLLYLPPGLDGREIRAQGLVRNAVTTSVALAHEAGQPVVIVTPSAFRSQLEEAVSSLSLDESLRPTLISPRGPSPAGWLAMLLHRNREEAARERRVQRAKAWLRRRLTTGGQWVLTAWWRVCIVTILLVATAMAFLTVLALAAWTLPPRLAVVITGSIALVALAAWLVRRRRGFLWEAVARSTHELSRRRSRLGTALERADVRHLVRRANRCNVSVWWCPSTLFGDVEHLREPLVSTFADYSPVEFPSMVLDMPRLLERRQEMVRAIRASAVVVCLSEHVRDRHLALLDPASIARSIVIPPGPPSRGPRLDASLDLGANGNATHASTLLGEFLPTSRAATIEWWEAPVITAPTQSRAYKNLRSLVTAVRILNVSYGLRVRLILTARPSEYRLDEFIEREGCSPHVEFLTDLPDNVLDAVLAASSLGITPSLFEGSLPFSLYESVSVGTPCLMANMPVTRAASVDDVRFQELTLFDPHDPQAIADSIRLSLDRLPDLLDCQREFLTRRLEQYGWKPTATRYLEAFATAKTSPVEVR